MLIVSFSFSLESTEVAQMIWLIRLVALGSLVFFLSDCVITSLEAGPICVLSLVLIGTFAGTVIPNMDEDRIDHRPLPEHHA